MSQPIRSEPPKPPAKRSPNPFADFLRRQARWLMLVAIVCAAIGGASYSVWCEWLARCWTTTSTGCVDALTITPQPAWIRTDLRKEIFSEGGFEQGVSLHEENLAERIAKTFALHPWVAKVERVSLHARASISCSYTENRSAWWKCQAASFLSTWKGSCCRATTLRPPRHGAIRDWWVTTIPAGLVGMPWGDLHVVGGPRSPKHLPIGGRS